MAQEEVDAISFLRQRYGGAQGQESQPSSAVDWLRSKYAPAPAPEGPGMTDYAGQSATSFAKGALDTGRMLLDFPATMGSAGAAMLGLNEVAETAKTLSPHYWAARGLQALERMVPTNEKVVYRIELANDEIVSMRSGTPRQTSLGALSTVTCKPSSPIASVSSA